MRTPAIALSALALLTLGCTANNTQPTPDQIRHDTAVATSTAVSDIKSAAQGIKDGLHQQAGTSVNPPININTATRPNLEVLPGITPPLARQIIAHRPYKVPADLRTKHVLTQAQLDEISSRITTNEL
jgi:DNA uptake protein ComE-like DNA-binding protein